MIHRFGLAQDDEFQTLIVGCETCDEPLVTVSIDPRDDEKGAPDNDVGAILREHCRQKDAAQGVAK